MWSVNVGSYSGYARSITEITFSYFSHNPLDKTVLHVRSSVILLLPFYMNINRNRKVTVNNSPLLCPKYTRYMRYVKYLMQ